MHNSCIVEFVCFMSANMNFPHPISILFHILLYSSPMLMRWIAHSSLQRVLPCDGQASSTQTSLTSIKTISNFKNLYSTSAAGEPLSVSDY